MHSSACFFSLSLSQAAGELSTCNKYNICSQYLWQLFILVQRAIHLYVYVWCVYVCIILALIWVFAVAICLCKFSGKRWQQHRKTRERQCQCTAALTNFIIEFQNQQKNEWRTQKRLEWLAAWMDGYKSLAHKTRSNTNFNKISTIRFYGMELVTFEYISRGLRAKIRIH